MKRTLITIIYVLIGYQFNYGQFWEKVITPDTALISSFCITNEGTILIGTWDDQYHDGGIYRSTDNGITWNFTSLTQFGTSVYSLMTSNNNYIFSGTSGYVDIYLSHDDGMNWSENFNAGPTNALSFFEDVDKQIFVGMMGLILKSSDYGANWHVVSDISTNNSINGFAQTSNYILFAVNWNFNDYTQNGVFRSEDGGETWDFIDIADDGFTSVEVNSLDEIFVSCYSEGMFKSSDYGETWILIPVNTVNDLFIDSNDVIYKASDYFGVSRSFNNGETWESISSGMGNVAHHFASSPDGHLYCRGGYSLFRSKVAVLDTGDSLVTPVEISLFPNPATGIITIEYPLSELNEEDIELFINDSTGKVVYTSKILDFITYLDISFLKEGIYIIHIKSEKHKYTGKLIIEH